MRLGITGTSYRALTGDASLSGLRYHGAGDAPAERTTAEYDWRGLPAPDQVVRERSAYASPELADAARAAALGLPVLHTVITDWSAVNLDALRAALATHGQELVPAIGANLMLEGDRLAVETERVTALLGAYARFGGVRLSKLSLSPMTVNRFRRDPPLCEQLRRLIAALPPIARAAEIAGIVLAFENHLDYRAVEVAEVIAAVGAPSLRFLFDSGNPFAVCEDPVDAARVAAPLTVLMHVKDVRVIPWTPLSLGYFACMYACPLGHGNVDLQAIVEIMAREAPDPDTLPLALEVRPAPPYLDEDRWLEDGVAFMTERFGRHLAGSPATDATRRGDPSGGAT